jgi:uncharacterized protein YndB with AHSA1/START domain
MFHVEHSVFVNASPEAVFDYVSDVLRHPEWADQPMEMTRDSGPERGVGAKFRSQVKFMGDVKGLVTVIDEERPRRFAYDAADNGGLFRWIFTLTPEGNGTRLAHYNERISAPTWVKLSQPIMYRVFGKKMMINGLANIKKRMEAGAQAPNS